MVNTLPRPLPFRRAPALRAALGALLMLAPLAQAQIVNPAEAQKPPTPPVPYEEPRLRSWELPATVVRAEGGNELREEDLVGSYEQPRWTARRLFSATRVYVIPEGQVEIEHWTRVMTPKHGPSTVETQYEIEFGLPNRFQLDLYAVTEKTGSEGELDWSSQKYELRYALADWGEIPLNPTLYVEWASNNASPDVLETKILLGGELKPSWHWGSNLVLEHEVSGERTNEYELTFGVSHTITDQKLSLGLEMKAALVDVASDRGNYEQELEIGPSLQYRPVPAMHIDFAPLIGIGTDSRASDVFLVLGWEF